MQRGGRRTTGSSSSNVEAHRLVAAREHLPGARQLLDHTLVRETVAQVLLQPARRRPAPPAIFLIEASIDPERVRSAGEPEHGQLPRHTKGFAQDVGTSGRIDVLQDVRQDDGVEGCVRKRQAMCPRDDRREWWSRGQLELEVAADESPAVEPSDAEGPGADFEQRIAWRRMLPEQPADGKMARRAIQKRERPDPWEP